MRLPPMQRGGPQPRQGRRTMAPAGPLLTGTRRGTVSQPTLEGHGHGQVAGSHHFWPEAPTRAALGLLVARAGIDEGHDVSIFLAGDGVQLIRDAVLDSLTGLGTGSLRESFDAIAAGGGRFYVSGMSSRARGVTEDDLKGKPAQLAMPNRLVQLAFETDRTFTY